MLLLCAEASSDAAPTVKVLLLAARTALLFEPSYTLRASSLLSLTIEGFSRKGRTVLQLLMTDIDLNIQPSLGGFGMPFRHRDHAASRDKGASA